MKSGLLGLGIAIFSMGLVLWSGQSRLTHARAMEKISTCASGVPEFQVQHYTTNLSYLIECARAELPALLDTAEEPLIMEWLLDAGSSPSNHFPELRSRLAALSLGTSLNGEMARLIAERLPMLLIAWGCMILFPGWKPRRDANLVPRALVIDDDHLFAQSVGRVLEKKGFQVDRASSTEEARALLVAGEAYDCIFCDHYLKDSTGLELCDSLLDEDSKKRCVIVSGSDPWEVFGGEDTPYAFLQKPCSSREIIRRAEKVKLIYDGESSNTILPS